VVHCWSSFGVTCCLHLQGCSQYIGVVFARVYRLLVEQTRGGLEELVAGLGQYKQWTGKVIQRVFQGSFFGPLHTMASLSFVSTLSTHPSYWHQLRSASDTRQRWNKTYNIRSLTYGLWHCVIWWAVINAQGELSVRIFSIKDSSILKLDSIYSSETSVPTYQTTRCHKSIEHNMNLHCDESLKNLTYL
jgi:hypothetical protein